MAIRSGTFFFPLHGIIGCAHPFAARSSAVILTVASGLAVAQQLPLLPQLVEEAGLHTLAFVLDRNGLIPTLSG